MIVCHSRRFVLIRPRKVASSSVQLAFVPHLGQGDLVMRLDGGAEMTRATVGYVKSRWPLVLRQHSSLARLVAVMGQQILDYRIITLARNPWDRAVSEFFYDNRAKDIRSLPAPEQKAAFTAWLHANAFLGPIKRTIYRLEGGNRISKLEQSALCVVKGRFRADHVIFYEDLAGGIKLVGDALNLDLHLPATKAKSGIRSAESLSWRAFYTDETRQLVARSCRVDIARYGYDFDTSVMPALRATASTSQ